MIWKKKESSNILSPNVGFFIGLILFVMVYGIKILNPFYVDWLLGLGDLSQHYLGWEFFRHDEWRFPYIGMTNRAAYPLETSVIFTDSIPIMAVFFKIFNSILPQNFQYFGIWGALCFGLQGYFSTKIFNLLNIKKSATFFGNIVLILSPIVIYRMYMHTALAAHWLVLLSLYLFLKHDMEYTKYWRISLEWWIIGALVAGIHLYFLPMCFFFVAGYVVLSMKEDGKLSAKNILPLITYVLSVFMNTWILGGFSSKADTGATGLGECNLNLNAFFNPRGFSRIIPTLGGTEGQHEGFTYLGLGLLIISLISILLMIFRCIKHKSINKLNFQEIVLSAIAVGSTLFAIATVYMWGDKELFTIPIPEKIAELWAVFRATGRYIWILWYLIAIYGIKIVSNMELTVKEHSYTIGLLILGLCTCIQIFDLSNVLTSRHKGYTSDVAYEYTEQDFWNALVEYRNFEHLCVSYRVGIIGDFMELGAIAIKYDLTSNVFYFAREIDGIWDNIEAIQREDAEADTIYVFLPEQEELLKECEHALRYYHVGKYVIGVSWLDADGNVNDFVYE